MKKYLITGCAGFIGSNFVYYMLKKYKEILLVNLDKLTYAGNLENLKGVEGDSRHVFVQGDICDRELVSSLFEKYNFDFVINFAAESHVDRSIANPEVFVQTNVMGTVNLLQRAKEAWYLSIPHLTRLAILVLTLFQDLHIHMRIRLRSHLSVSRSSCFIFAR